MLRDHALRVAARRYFGAMASPPPGAAADDARCWRRSPLTGLPCLLPAGHGGRCWRWEARA